MAKRLLEVMLVGAKGSRIRRGRWKRGEGRGATGQCDSSDSGSQRGGAYSKGASRGFGALGLEACLAWQLICLGLAVDLLCRSGGSQIRELTESARETVRSCDVQTG